MLAEQLKVLISGREIFMRGRENFARGREIFARGLFHHGLLTINDVETATLRSSNLAALKEISHFSRPCQILMRKKTIRGLFSLILWLRAAKSY